MQSLELGAQSPTDEDVEAPASDSAAVDSQLPGDGVYHFILNPSSGSESLSEEELRSMLEDAGFKWQIHKTHNKEDLREMTEAAINAGAGAIIACGGDGTVSEVAENLVGKDVVFGIIPSGTANVISTELCIAGEIEDAVALLASSRKKIKKIDVGVLGDKVFLLRVGMGLAASMTLEADKDLKRSLGKWAYLLTALRLRRQYARSRYTINVDGKTYKCKGVAGMICNSANAGMQGAKFLEDIDLSDGYIHLVIVPDAGFKTIFAIMRKVFRSLISFGRKTHPKDNIRHWKGEKISVRSKPLQLVSRDGEEVEDTRLLKAHVIPGALTVFTGEDA